MEDTEEVYVEGLEKEGEIFLEGLQNKKSLGELEKQYSKKVKEIRRIYEKSIKKELGIEKEKTQDKTHKKIQQEDIKEFQVENIGLEKSWKEKKRIEISSKGYKIKRKIKNFLIVITPNYLIYIYYKIKRIVKDFFKDIQKFFERIWEKGTENGLIIVIYIKEGFIKVISIIKKVVNIFKRKNTKDQGKDKKEDGKTDSAKQTKQI